MPVHIRVSTHDGRAAVVVGNENISLTVLPGGGHIARVEAPGVPFNPLWEPPWRTAAPSLRRLAGADPADFSQAPADRLESELLACICGHNLCCDVFGSHSGGEVEKGGASFHGEAGMRTWDVVDVVPGRSVTLEAHLWRSQLVVRRTYAPDPAGRPVVVVTESLENLLGVERALGRSQHVSVGADMLRPPAAAAQAAASSSPRPKDVEGDGGGCRFACNADRGMTWPDDGPMQTFQHATQFEYPFVPAKTAAAVATDGGCGGGGGGDGRVSGAGSGDPLGGGGAPTSPADGGAGLDWRRFPRNGGAPNSDLLTLRVDPADAFGWFVAERDLGATEGHPDGGSVALGYRWERAAFPWLMTWEENRARQQAPWSGRTLVRGLEFGSYAFATSRRANVEMGSLLGQRCFEWLDAHERKETKFWITLQVLPARRRTAGETDAPGGATPLPALLERVGYSDSAPDAPQPAGRQ